MKLNIKTPPLKGIQLHSLASQILNPCFISLIIGPPGSGKTSILKAMIQDPKFYGQKFDKIIFVGPSPFDDSFDESSRLDTPDCQMIQAFLEKINQQNTYEDLNILFIFDDCITQMNQKQDFWKKLFLNRRHILKNGTISHILTTQKFSLVPPFIRACITECFTFKCNQYQAASLSKWFISKDKLKQFLNLMAKLGQHQFLFINFLRAKIYNSQFVDIDKKVCRLKIGGPIGYQQSTQLSQLSNSFIGQEEMSAPKQPQVKKEEMQLVQPVKQEVQDKMMQALSGIKKGFERSKDK